MIGIVFVQAAFAAQVALRLAAEELREGQTVQLDLVVVDTTTRDVPRIEVPAGLQVAYKGQSVERQILNFQATSTTTFSYALTALVPGDYVLGPVSVPTAAGTLASTSLKVHVAPRSAGDVESLTATLGTEVAWVGQVLVYGLRFQTDKNMVNGRWTPPDAPGFTVEPSVEPVTAEYRLEQDGKPLAVQELHYPLRAASPGRWTVPGGVLQAQYAVTDSRRRRPGDIFDGIGAFGNVRTEVYSAAPLEVEVRELPAEGRPADASGLVGSFTISARASDAEARVGDTVTVEVTVEGTGALAGFALPPLEGTDLRVYDDQPVVEARIEDGQYRAKAMFKRAIVPQAPGEIDVPPIVLAYFDPATSSWARAASEPIHLVVGGEAERANVETFGTTGPRTVDALGEDILPVRTDARLDPPWPRGLALAFLAPGALALLAQGLLARRRRPVAASRVAQGFDDLPADPDARLAAVERIFRERVGARLGIPPDALRREDLTGLGAGAAEADQVYRELERCRYGGHAVALPEQRVRTLVEGLR